jgi:hypothetical protein
MKFCRVCHALLTHREARYLTDCAPCEIEAHQLAAMRMVR